MTRYCQTRLGRRLSLATNDCGSARPLALVLLAVFVVCIGVGIAGGSYLVRTYTQIADVENEHDIVPELPESSPDAETQDDADGQKGTVDFEALQEQNPDIYAWIYIPNTNINYPVCQSAQSNDYYLSHSASGEDSEVGAIFSEAQFNHANFDDRVTVLYGHNGYADAMFSTLHDYERQEYLDEHARVYIYTPEKVLTYEIFSTFTAGNRHIMDAFELQSDEGFMTFVSYLMNPDSIDAHVKERAIGVSDKLLVLSTCGSGVLEAQGRYLVCGVLADEQPTA